MGTDRRAGAIPAPRSAAIAGGLLLLCCAAAATGGSAPPAPPADRRTVCIRGSCFDAEVAVTAAERGRGLMFRRWLAPGDGMLFVFPREDRHGFWMKNTLIELDIVFIGADRRVVDIARRAAPCRSEPCAQYYPAVPAAYVLEIAGGLADRLGLAAGDPVEFREATPARRPASGTP